MKSSLIRYGGPAAGLGGALCIATFGMVYRIYGLFREQAKTTFFGGDGFVYVFYAPMYVLLLLGTAGVYLRQRSYFELVGKAGFYLTALEFSLGAIGSATIMAIAGDEATVSVLNLVAHALSHVFYALGSVLLSIATYRAGVLPKGAVVMRM